MRDAPPLPLFKPDAAPPCHRLSVGGYFHGDAVWVASLDRPDYFQKAMVLAALVQHHNLVLKLESSGANIDLNPILHPKLIKTRFKLGQNINEDHAP